MAGDIEREHIMLSWFWSGLLSSFHCVTASNMRMLDHFVCQKHMFWFYKRQITILLTRLFWGLSNMRCVEMTRTVKNTVPLQEYHCKKHNQLQPSMSAKLLMYLHKDQFILPRCHDFVVSSLDSLMSLGHLETKPKANSKEMK